MIVKISTSKLQEVLDLVSRFVSKHSTLPVLENIYIKGNVDSLLFRATDMEKYIEFTVNAEIQSEGALTVNAKTFTEIIKSIDDEEVELIVDDSNDSMKIKTINDEFSIKGIPANEYVAVPEVSGSNSIQLSSDHFSRGISKVEYAVTERNFSPVLTGILVKLKKDADATKLIFVGTDSFRLAEFKVNYEGDSRDSTIIIPKLNIGEIKKVSDYFIDKGGEDMKIIFSENLISFNFELGDSKILCTSLLIQGNFPDYDNENIIPKNFSTKVTVDKNLLEKAIKKISILTRDINNFIDISINEGTIVVTSGETDKGDAKTVIPAVISGDNINLGVNGKYILDFLRSIDSSEVILNIVNSERPVVLNDSENGDYLCVVRPLVK